ncbi:glutathione S-transferase T2-like [Papaver somniferum]|uniref:glutathione S-transferase T2-like n=1 Tax=Papaver somniferum TaxID=3469 RepID=UPI000E6F937F|nr:glutathione S-transferase T2-like [Papaver somniferum]
MEEDVALTKAWLYVTQDAITGRDQPSDRMWNRIWGVWRDNMVNPDGRGWNALKCHWKGIQTQVCKFHGIYEMLERHPPSGNKLQDIVMEAKFLFEGNDKGPFKYEHCWEIMKANPKWCSQQLTLANSSKKLKVLDGDSVDTGTASVPNNEEEYLDVDGVDRGPGRKKAKENVQKMHDQKAVVDMLSSYKSTLEKQHAINQQNMEWREQMFKKDFELREKSQKLKEETQKSKQKAYKRKEQERILNTNLEKLQPVLRIAYEKMQAQILKEWENEGLFGDEVMNGGADISSI